MKNSFSLILEILWIVIGIVCVFAGLRSVIIKDSSGIIAIFFVMALISFAFAWFRHIQRKKF
jgi:hypothetical protein